MLWASAGAFFSARQLVSARNSHSSGVRGLVVRCLLFNPEGSCSNGCVCTNFFLQAFQSRRIPLFSALWDFPPFRLCENFRKFLNVLKGSSLQFFLIFCNRTSIKKSPRVRFLDSMRLFKILIFCILEISVKSTKGPLQFFDILQQTSCYKISKSPPFTVFGIVKFFKMNNFRLKLGSLKPSTVYPICFFKDRRFFYATFF